MLRTISKRLLQTIIVVFFLESFTFFAVRAVPGGPFASEKAIPAHVLARMKAEYGLDEGIFTQYAIFWKKLLLERDLGPSFSNLEFTCTEIIARSFPTSLTLGIIALIMGVGLGMPLGTIAALKRNGWLDYSSMIVAMIGICVPAFVLGPMLQLWVARPSNFFSVGGWNSLQDVLLPAITLATGVAAYVARLTRGGMLEVLSQDYIRTARSKGVPMPKIITKHALRGALIPAVTYLGPAFAAIITGSFVVETIFQVPGMGQHFVIAVTTKDYNLLQALVLFYGILMGCANLVVDIILAWLNPRLRN